ncbi:class III signal peptide-containing protein [Methanobrevibacter curvatus]|uniref:Class III signal peptide n=1 Tax=Methanobrevibacter curvatus TaxID=49547 RepID=A0A162FAT1_9EURY|nr:class III signal peptide-containing protein [Methanobrevibacter curvatus]KZX10365.1 class III signal peptide [Methanobrevibacter curvatus]
MKIKSLIKENNGQLSGEMILLMGIIIVIVIIVANFIVEINSSINHSMVTLIENGRDYALNKL